MIMVSMSRYLSAAECAYKILHQPTQTSQPLVMHLQDEQTIIGWDDDQTELSNPVQRSAKECPSRMAWFDYNASHPKCSHLQLLYHHFRKHFIWQTRAKEWQPKIIVLGIPTKMQCSNLTVYIPSSGFQSTHKFCNAGGVASASANGM